MSSSSSDLYDDVLTEILLRLPPESVLRCRATWPSSAGLLVADAMINLSPAQPSEDGAARWIAPFKVIEDYFTADGSSQPQASDDSVLVAVMKGHQGPVQGLSFSTFEPHMLASGGCLGKIIIWDISRPSSESIPYFEFTQMNDPIISHLAWNPKEYNIVATASNAGVAMLDIRTKSRAVSELAWPRDCSTVEWSPANDNQLAVGARDESDLPSIQVWDVRKANTPLKELCENTKGIISLSWSPFVKDVLLACTRSNKMVILDVDKELVIYEYHEPGRLCLDIKWHSKEHFIAAMSGEEDDSQVVLYHTDAK